MKIKFHCSCGKRIKVLLHKIGKRIQCPLCYNHMYVPDIDFPNVIQIECDCGEQLPKGTSHCPACDREISKKTALEAIKENESEQQLTNPQIFTSYTDSPDRHKKIYLLWGLCLLTIIGSHLYIYHIHNKTAGEVNLRKVFAHYLHLESGKK